MKFIILTMVTGQVEGEDDLETETTCEVAVNPAEVRSFYPRKGGRQGTRLVFKSGVGCPVTESFGTVADRFANFVN